MGERHPNRKKDKYNSYTLLYQTGVITFLLRTVEVICKPLKLTRYCMVV